MSFIIDTVLSHLPYKRKHTPSGWIAFNAPCCGDKRSRGGLIIAGNSISFHCFNCQFKASWQPGRPVSQKFRKLMQFLNVSDDLISKSSLEALRLTEQTEIQELLSPAPTFDVRALPMDAEPIASYLDDIPEDLVPVLEYLMQRGLYLEDYPFYWTPKPGFNNRLIIPFYFQNKLVGYTARKVTDNKNPRYISEQQPGYVFNLDRQTHDRQFVIVCEGPLDAISIDGCAILGADIKDKQHWLLKQLDREIIFVPDRDHEGPKTVKQAIEYGYSVSMPDWPEGIKDINDAVVKLGRLTTLWMILEAKESYHLKITLRAKNWFKENNL